MSQVRIPAKTAIRVDALIESTYKTLQGAAADRSLAPLAQSAMSSFVETLAQTLLQPEQQKKIGALLEVWKTCRPVV
jgi:hypothetical protein